MYVRMEAFGKYTMNAPKASTVCAHWCKDNHDLVVEREREHGC